MQQNETETTITHVHPGLHARHIENREIRQSVTALVNYLHETGKICPRPWYWERFFILFRPRYEPCWLSSWWQTPVEEKKELMRKQIYYLAYRTNRFREACKFLYEIGDDNWLHQQRSEASPGSYIA